MRSSRNLPRGGVGAIVFGGAVAFVVGERAVEAIRPVLLLHPDPGWLVARFLLWIFLASAVAGAGCAGRDWTAVIGGVPPLA